MKMSIKWHKECLKNKIAHKEKLERRLPGIQNEIDRLNSEIDFYETQIEEAEKRNKDGFDQDLFLRKVDKA